MDKTPSVTRKRREITVAPSPFNPVKFELGLIMLLAVAVYVMVEKWVDNSLLRWTVLAATGILSMLWLILRSMQVSRKVRQDLGKEQATEER